jgi:hypothetical protein
MPQTARPVSHPSFSALELQHGQTNRKDVSGDKLDDRPEWVSKWRNFPDHQTIILDAVHSQLLAASFNKLNKQKQ